MAWCFQIVAFMWFFGYCGIADASVYKADSSRSEIRFEVSSTLHDFTGHAAELSGTVDYDPVTGQAITPFEIYVPVRSLNTAHAARDKAMLKMFDVKNFPEAVWRVQSFVCGEVSPEGERKCAAGGMFIIHGKSVYREKELLIKKEGESLWIQGRFDLMTDEFGLKPPSVLGVIRVAKKVNVLIQTEWKKAA